MAVKTYWKIEEDEVSMVGATDCFIVFVKDNCDTWNEQDMTLDNNFSWDSQDNIVTSFNNQADVVTDFTQQADIVTDWDSQDDTATSWTNQDNCIS